MATEKEEKGVKGIVSVVLGVTLFESCIEDTHIDRTIKE
jgi:hypothetical protein